MTLSPQQLAHIKQNIVALASTHGFQDARVSDCDTGDYFTRFTQWVEDGYHGEMSYLERNQELRQYPEQLHPNTCRIISFRFDYLPEHAQFADTLKDNQRANVSRYALGRDYHKILRKKLNQVCQQLQKQLETNFKLEHRVFVDSAPVLETAFAEKSGLGWKGKHTLIINKEAGSWFFLGEIFINIPLEIDQPVEDLCGQCNACISLCPTNAILESNKVDATRCISYLTIENKQAIPQELRPLMGNRIYGCDDCQLACPWNRFSNTNQHQDFSARHSLDNISLIELWSWSEQEFLDNFQGSPIRRIGYQSWLRNLAVALGNSQYSEEIVRILTTKKVDANEMVIEHIDWAINQLKSNKQNIASIQKNQTRKLINCVVRMMPRDA